MSLSKARSINIAILALGGQGGGVLVDWIVGMAEHEGWTAQSTSVAGVAQRTGATIYYVELVSPQDKPRPDAQPVLALMAVPGDVDVLIAAELMEAGRAIQRGLVSRERTTLIASTHRVLAIGERMAMGDGSFDVGRLLRAVKERSRTQILFDMDQAAEESGGVINAVTRIPLAEIIREIWLFLAALLVALLLLILIPDITLMLPRALGYAG